MILNDAKYIYQRDSKDMLGAAQKMWQQLEHTPALQGQLTPPKNIVVCALGGSAAAARLGNAVSTANVPIEIISDYALPDYVGPDTLCIAMSFSGNTEETTSALQEARSKQAQVAIITSGGELLQSAKDNDITYVALQESQHPRLETLQFMIAYLTVLEKAGCIDAVDMKSAADYIQRVCDSCASTVPLQENTAKQLAVELAGTTPIIHSGNALSAAAHIWKLSINESAKNVAFTSTLPEFSHNEFIGWTSHPVDKLFSIVDLRSKAYDHPRVSKRFDVTEQLLSGQRPHPHTVWAEGSNQTEQILYAAVLGIFVGIYLALLNGVDPTPVEKVNAMKQALDK